MDDFKKINEQLENYLQKCTLNEMATVGRINGTYITVTADSGRNYYNQEYFKIFNNESPSKATKVARILFRRPEYIYHKDQYEQWNLNVKERKALNLVFKQKSKYQKDCTIWEYGILQFNLETYDIPFEESKQITMKTQKDMLEYLSEQDKTKNKKNIYKYCLPIDLPQTDYTRLQ